MDKQPVSPDKALLNATPASPLAALNPLLKIIFAFLASSTHKSAISIGNSVDFFSSLSAVY